MQVYKRQQSRGFEPHQSQPPVDETTEKLQSLGMRIRQSVSNGYKLPTGNETNSLSYMNNYEQQQMLNNNRRIQLPSHLQNNGPPPLDYNGSTASSLACWEDEINNNNNNNNNDNTFTTLNSFYSNNGFNDCSLKRGFDQIEAKDMQVNDFVERYGPLSFNEEF